MKKYLFIFLFSFEVNAITNDVICDFLSISNACQIQNEGDVLHILPGSCVLSNIILIANGKSLVIRGSGTNQTTLISTNTARCFQIVGASTNMFEFSDLNCVGNVNNSFGFLDFEFLNGPFHIYHVQMTNILARGINVVGGSSGLIEYSCFTSPGTGGPQSVSFGGLGYKVWTNSFNPIGTTNVACVENCMLTNFLNVGNGFFDAYNGAQLVWRFNYMNGFAPSGVHGYDSQPTGARTWEIYGNTFDNASGSLGIELRSGTGIVASNRFNGYSVAVQLAYYRSSAANHAGTVNTRGIPGQGYILSNFVNNATNNTSIGINTYTVYTFLTVYAPNANHTGFNGYGGGNVVIGSDLPGTLANLNLSMIQGAGRGTIWAPSDAVDLGTGLGFNHDFLPIEVRTNTLVLTNALDGNTDAYGYPAAFAHGVINSYPITSSNFVQHAVIWPAYAWGNILNGTNQDFTLKDYDAASFYYITNIIKEGRDYFNGIVPATNIWKPLQFPHPLSISYNSPSVSSNGVFNLKTVKVGGMIKLQ